MKKILSLVTVVSIVATMMTSFVTVSAATITPTVNVTATAMTNDEFKAIADMDIPEGYAMYNLTVDLSNIGELKYYKDGLKYSGRLLDVGQIDIYNLGTYADSDFTMVLSNCFNQTATEGFDNGNFMAAYASGAVNACYPYSASTVSEVDDMYSILIGAKTTESFTLDYKVSGCISIWTKGVAPTTEDQMENFAVTGTVQFGEGGNDTVQYTAISTLSQAAQDAINAKFTGKTHFVKGDVISYTSDGTEYYIEATDGTNTAKTKRSIESYLNISEAGVAVKVIPVLVTADAQGPAVTFTKVN